MKVDAERPSRPAPTWQGPPAGISWQSSRQACHTRNHGRWRILLRLPFTHCLLLAQKAHFTQSSDGSEYTQCPINLRKIGGHEQELTHNEWRTHEHCCKLGWADAPRTVCTATQMWENFLFARLLTITSGASYPSPLCPHAPCLVHACANILFAHVCHTCCVCIDLSSRIFAYGPLGGRVYAPLSLCMHAHCYCVIYSEGLHARLSACGCMHISSMQYVTNTGFWLFLETFVYLLILALAVILSPFPLPIPFPTTLRPNIPPVLFPSSRPLGGDSLPWSLVAKLMIGARQLWLCLSLRSILPAPWPAKISHLASHPHNTLACNNTSLPPPPLPHPCTL